MRYSTAAAAAALVAAMNFGEVVAGPTHAHAHRVLHQKKE